MKVDFAAVTFSLFLLVSCSPSTELTRAKANAPIGQAMKEVFFRCSATSIPEIVKPLVVFDGTGTAIIRLFDDGWRIEQFSKWDENQTHTLTSGQMSQITQSKKAEAERVAAIERRKAERYRVSLKTNEASLQDWRFKHRNKLRTHRDGCQCEARTIDWTRIRILVRMPV